MSAHLHVEKDSAQLSQTLAKFVAEKSKEAVSQRGVFHIVISGGFLHSTIPFFIYFFRSFHSLFVL